MIPYTVELQTWWPATDERFAVHRVPVARDLAVRAITAGPKGAPTVVMVHGWGIHSYLWRRTVPALLEAGLRICAFDLPGHGLSDRPLTPGTYTLDGFTDALHAVVDWTGETRVSVVGQSMGGRIATEFARRAPERMRALALIGSVGFGEVPTWLTLATRLPVPRGKLGAVLAQRWMVALGKAYAYGTRATPSAEAVDAYWAATQIPNALAAFHQALAEFDWRPLTTHETAAIRVPTLLFFGTRDRTVRPVHAESLLHAMPNGELRWLQDAGHVANEEVPEEVNPALVEFIVGHT